MGFFAFDGKVFIAPRQSNGNPGAFRYLGKTEGFQFGMQTKKTEIKEKESGQRLTALSLIDEKTASLQVDIREWNKENVALGLWGQVGSIAAGTVTAEPGPNPLAAGDHWRLQKPKVSSVVVKDSAGSPATLTLGTHYEIENSDFGMLKILDMASFVQPLKADYSNALMVNIPMFGVIPGYWWVRLEAVNRADATAPALVEFYNVSLDPLADFATKPDSGASTINLSGAPLYDELKAGDATLGQFGRIVMP